MPSKVVDFEALRAKRGNQVNLESKLLNYVAQAVITTDLEGNSIYWNQAAEQLYGWNASTVFDRKALQGRTLADPTGSVSEVLSGLRNGRSWSGGLIVCHAAGGCVRAWLSGHPLYDSRGDVVGVVWVSAESMQRSEGRRGKPRISFERIRSTLIECRQSIAAFAREPGLLQGSALAILLYVGALGARILLDQIVPGRFPYVSFWPAILLASFLCGIWPTIALLFASAATMALWGARPQDEPLSFHLLLVMLFLFIGALLATPVFYLKAAQRRIKERDEQMAVINGELKHRLKNLFAVTSAICRQTLKSKTAPEEIGALIDGRIQALAAAQDLLTITSEKCALRSLVDKITKPLVPSESRLQITGPDVCVPAESTTQFALVLHELATNAVKHGAWRPTSQGRVSLEWRKRNERQLELEWSEDCPGGIAKPSHEGFGSVVIRRGLRSAKVDHEVRANGVRCHIELEI